MDITSTEPANGTVLVGRKPIFYLHLPVNGCAYRLDLIKIRLESDDSEVVGMNYDNAGHPTLRFFANPDLANTMTLAANTAYYLDIAQSGLYECEINPYGNQNNRYLIHFTTGACVANGVCSVFQGNPVMLHKSPPDGAHFMQGYQGINITLDQTVTASYGNITIKKYDDDAIFETIDTNSSRISGWGTNSITIDPSGNLLDNTHYYVNLDWPNYSSSSDKDNWDFWTKSTPNIFSGTGL